MTLQTIRTMANIANKYNAQDPDKITGASDVSNTDIQLLNVIRDLYEVISDLNQRIDGLSFRVHALETGDVEDRETTRDIYRECCG